MNDELNEHIESLSKSVDWACAEIERLRAENLELKLHKILRLLNSITIILNCATNSKRSATMKCDLAIWTDANGDMIAIGDE
jgi:hypothetical protein